MTASLFNLKAIAQESSPYPVLQFRFVESADQRPLLELQTPLRLLADADFPPFSFKSGNGAMEGIAVDAAMEACREIGAACEVVPRDWASLSEALAKGEGDAIISGPRLDQAVAGGLLATRPYFRAAARFAVRAETPIEGSDIRSLAGKRLATVKGSAHAAWLAEYYPQAAITAFDTPAAALDALRTGTADAAFGDGLQLVFWTTGTASRGCCRLLPGAYFDDAKLSPAAGFVFRAERADLMRAFDYGLDRAQLTGAFASIFRRYVPASPW